MTITDATAQGGVDAAALANAFTESLRRSGLVVAPAATTVAKPEDHFKAAIKELAAGTEGGEASFAGIEKLFSAFEKDVAGKVSEQQRKEFYGALAQERDRSTINLIYMSLDNYIGDDATLLEYRDILKDKVIQEFNTNKDYQDAARRYGEGSVDIPLLKKIALAEVNKFNKGRGVDAKTSKGPTGLNSTDAAATGKLPAGGEGGEFNSEDPDQLTGRELNLYRAKLGTAQRAGMGYDSPKAREFALKGVQTFRKGKQKAKDALGSTRVHKD